MTVNIKITDIQDRADLLNNLKAIAQKMKEEKVMRGIDMVIGSDEYEFEETNCAGSYTVTVTAD